MKLSKILITLSVIAGITYSCNRDETTTSSDVAAKQEMIQTESTSDFVTENTSEVAMDFATAFEATFNLRSTSVGQHPDYPCAIVTVASTNGGYPKTITVDFGTGCTDKRGITRKGKIIITVTSKILVPGAIITMTHDNFYVDNKKVEGEIKLTNITTSPASPAFSKEVNNGRITREDGSYFTFNSLRNRRMTSGVATPKNVWDDVWEIYEGSQTVTKSTGNYITSTIKTPLVKSNACHYTSKGSITLKGTNVDGVLDFGNGDCDNLATFTDANGTVQQITLKR